MYDKIHYNKKKKEKKKKMVMAIDYYFLYYECCNWSRLMRKAFSNMQACSVSWLCLTLCDPMDCSLPGGFVHGILQERILGVGCHSLLQGSFWPRDWTQVSCIAGRFFITWVTRESLLVLWWSPNTCHIYLSYNKYNLFSQKTHLINKQLVKMYSFVLLSGLQSKDGVHLSFT